MNISDKVYFNKRKFHCDDCKHSFHFKKNWECLRGVYLQDCYEKENILRIFYRIYWTIKRFLISETMRCRRGS
jgi:hypothetical protein